jgi:ArsR family transcriptional regulator, arsenate/arsenite/antimonite-responsive transcriptional repressor
MEDQTQQIDFLSNIFKILGDPTRLKLFSILLEGVHCNCELVALTGLPNNLISHHMHILCEAGLILSTRKKEDARWIYYSINWEKIDLIQKSAGSFLDVKNVPDREPVCQKCDDSC